MVSANRNFDATRRLSKMDATRPDLTFHFKKSTTFRSNELQAAPSPLLIPSSLGWAAASQRRSSPKAQRKPRNRERQGMLWMRYLHRSVLLVSLSRLVSPVCATCACLLHPAGALCSAESRVISSQTAVSCIRALRTRCNVTSPRPDCHAISVKRGMPRAAPVFCWQEPPLDV